ncbi:uncharacterized protein [Taeniopygia guttata]
MAGPRAGGRRLLLLPARLRRPTEPAARRGGRSRCGPAAPGTGSATGPAALTWRPGAPVPGGGGAGRALPASLPASLRAAGAGRAGRGGEGTRCPPGGGSAAALPALPPPEGVRGGGSPLLPQGRAALREQRAAAGKESGARWARWGRPRPPAAETFSGGGGVGSGREMRAAAGAAMGALPAVRDAPPPPRPGGHRRANLRSRWRSRPGRGLGRLSGVYSGRADAARAAASRSDALALPCQPALAAK